MTSAYFKKPLYVNSSLIITKAKWKASSNKLSVKGDGAVPRQLVSVFDAITGQLLGTDQSNAVGKWKVKVRNLITISKYTKQKTLQLFKNIDKNKIDAIHIGFREELINNQRSMNKRKKLKYFLEK